MRKQGGTAVADELKTIKFQMMLSESEAKMIDDWGFSNRIRSRAEAIRRLCQMALYVDPVFLDLMSKLTTFTGQGEGSAVKDDAYLKAAEAHAAWTLLRQGETLEDGMQALEAAKDLIRLKREQEK